jgi:hypothetical protein
MAKQPQGTKVVQVELQHETTHTVCWVEESLKPATGMILICGKDPRRWEVVKAYTRLPVFLAGINSGWKVGGLG